MIITGKITGSDGDGLPGAVVFASDAAGKPVIPSYSATADVNGNFKLTLPGSLENGYIAASFVGTKTQIVRPAGVTNFNMPDIGNLPEVEIIAPKITPKPPVKKAELKPAPKTDYTNYYIGFGVLAVLIAAIIYKSKKG
jgi:hypothetical protein